MNKPREIVLNKKIYTWTLENKRIDGERYVADIIVKTSESGSILPIGETWKRKVTLSYNHLDYGTDNEVKTITDIDAKTLILDNFFKHHIPSEDSNKKKKRKRHNEIKKEKKKKERERKEKEEKEKSENEK